MHIVIWKKCTARTILSADLDICLSLSAGWVFLTRGTLLLIIIVIKCESRRFCTRAAP